MKTYRKPKVKIVNTKGHVILAGSGEDGFTNKTTSGEQLGKNSLWSSMDEE